MRYEVLADSYLPDLTGEDRIVAHKGEIVHRYTGPTYGCINWSNGIACSRGGPRQTPFFEVPIAHLRVIGDTGGEG